MVYVELNRAPIPYPVYLKRVDGAYPMAAMQHPSHTRGN